MVNSCKSKVLKLTTRETVRRKAMSERVASFSDGQRKNSAEFDEGVEFW